MHGRVVRWAAGHVGTHGACTGVVRVVSAGVKEKWPGCKQGPRGWERAARPCGS